MDVITVTRQMIEFQKRSFDQFQNILDLTHTHVAGAMDQVLDEAPLPKEGRQALEKWRTLVQANRKQFAAYVDRGLSIYESMLPASDATPPVKTTKTSTTKTSKSE